MLFFLLKSENTREMQSSYDLLLQQQQLFLQWQREVEESRALGTSQVTLEISHCLTFKTFCKYIVMQHAIGRFNNSAIVMLHEQTMLALV